MSGGAKSGAFIERVLRYASSTSIKLRRVPRRGSWQASGLPDLRGFTPHLRAVNICEDQNADTKDLWLIHDLLHIIFYDFAAITLGDEAWQDEDRFIECHLASEAFAVLALDYHHLIHTEVKGLAVDLDVKEWRGFQQKFPFLPDVTSFDFCKMIVEHYLSGEGQLVELYKEAKAGGTGGKKFTEWLGHEIRYADKQRAYVIAWLEDLMQVKPSKKKAHVDGSFVAGPLWGLIEVFHEPGGRAFESFLEESRARFKNGVNFFAAFSKYKSKKPLLDFRFTDVVAVERELAAETVEKAKTPTASNLFLFWQLISFNSPALVSDEEKRAVQKLAITSQTNDVDARAWKTVRKLAQSTLENASWDVDASGRATFFLP